MTSGVLKKYIFVNLGIPSPWYRIRKLQAEARGVFPWEATHCYKHGMIFHPVKDGLRMGPQ